MPGAPSWTIFSALASLLADAVSGIYLPPSQTRGGEYLFDPASPQLRQAITAPPPRASDRLDARALADDLRFLRRALRQQYAGYPELLQMAEFDVEALFDEQIARLHAGPPRVTFQESAVALFEALKSHINDRHLGLVGAPSSPREDYREYQLPVEGPAPSVQGCGGRDVAPSTSRVASLARADGTMTPLLTVSAHFQGETLQITCGGTVHQLRPRPPNLREEGQADKPAYEWRRVGPAAVIRLRRLQGTPADHARLRRLAADYPDHRRAPLLIFDLRGNGGGDDSYVYHWIERAKRGAWDPQVWSIYLPASFHPWLAWNNHVWEAIQQGRIDDPAAVAEREKVRAQWPARASDLVPRFAAYKIENHAEAPYQGRIFALVDRGSGSSAESSSLMLREALGATLVGERTAGFIEYGNQRKLVLPDTHLVVFFSTKRDYSTTPLEALGLPVDVYLSPEHMGAPVEELIPILRKLPRAAR